MNKWGDNKAWFLVIPVLVFVAFSAIIPLMTVINYSVQDILAPGKALFVGTEWYKKVLHDFRLHDALWRQFLFSALVLLIEMPLGILIALADQPFIPAAVIDTLIERLATTMMSGAFCGLGQAAPIPILGCLKYFRNEFVNHISNGGCAMVDIKYAMAENDLAIA